MDIRRQNPFLLRVLLALLLTSISTLWLVPVASAQQTAVITDQGDGDTVLPGDNIDVGFDVSVPDAGSTQTSVSITSTVLQLSFNCSGGGSQTLTINGPATTITVGANYTGDNPPTWGANAYTTQYTVPSNFCGGNSGTETGGVSTFMYGCGDHQGRCHEICFRRHHRHFHCWSWEQGWGGSCRGEGRSWGNDWMGQRVCIPPRQCVSPPQTCCKFQ